MREQLRARNRASHAAYRLWWDYTASGMIKLR